MAWPDQIRVVKAEKPTWICNSNTAKAV